MSQGISDSNKIKPLVEMELRRLEQLSIIQKSKSDYSSPAFAIKNGWKLQLVVNYRRLNHITKKMPFPFPDLRYQLLQLGGSRIFSQIDLANGYHQILMKPTDAPKTAFVINGEHYEYLRIPFGLSNALKTFQRDMKSLLGHLTYVKIFLDDILIHSEDYKRMKNI